MNIDKEFVLEFVNRLRGTSLVRVGGGIAVIGAVALTSIVQYLVVAIFESAGVQIRSQILHLGSDYVLSCLDCYLLS